MSGLMDLTLRGAGWGQGRERVQEEISASAALVAGGISGSGGWVREARDGDGRTPQFFAEGALWR